MATRKVIRTLQELQAFRNKIRSLRGSLGRTTKINIERAADEAVLTDIHRKMELNNFSKKIIDATFVGDIENSNGNLKVHFISDYVSDDLGFGSFDVSKGREEGTRDHDVFPKKGKWLSWIDKRTGKRVFRRKSHPKGIERLLIIERTINSNQQKFQDSLERANIAANRQALT